MMQKFVSSIDSIHIPNLNLLLQLSCYDSTSLFLICASYSFDMRVEEAFSNDEVHTVYLAAPPAHTEFIHWEQEEGFVLRFIFASLTVVRCSEEGTLRGFIVKHNLYFLEAKEVRPRMAAEEGSERRSVPRV
jgi:hypothetical protein